MADSTSFIRPAVEAFKSGTLHMATGPTQGSVISYEWGEYPVNIALVVASVFFFLFFLDSFLHCNPTVLSCLTRWRNNYRLENSVPLVRSRNWTFASCILPFCLIAARFNFFDIDFITQQPAEYRTAFYIGVFLAFILLRFVIYQVIRPVHGSMETYRIAHRSAMNFFIPYTILLLVTIGVLRIFHMDPDTVRMVLLCETGAVYLVYLFTKLEILGSSYGVLTTFLYLCGLEILPAAALTGAILWL